MKKRTYTASRLATLSKLKNKINSTVKNFKIHKSELAVLSDRDIYRTLRYLTPKHNGDISLSFFLDLCETLGYSITLAPNNKPVNINSIEAREKLNSSESFKKFNETNFKRYEKKYGKHVNRSTTRIAKPKPARREQVQRALTQENDFLRIDGDSD